MAGRTMEARQERATQRGRGAARRGETLAPVEPNRGPGTCDEHATTPENRCRATTFRGLSTPAAGLEPAAR